MARFLTQLSLISVLIAMATSIPQGSAQSYKCSFIYMVCGNSASNTLSGTHNTDWMFGWGGNDTLRSSSKWDYINGGEGDDTVSYANSPSRVIVSLKPDERGIGGYAEGDYLRSIEGIDGSNYSDILEGGSDYSDIWGGLGNDYIFAGPGGGAFHGGDGNDIIYSHSTTDTSETVEVSGGEGDDRIIVRGGYVRAKGGGGKNIFIITRDVEEVKIELTNREAGINKIDLSAWPEIRNLDDLETKWGLLIYKRIGLAFYELTIDYYARQSMIIEKDMNKIDGGELTPDDFIFASP